MTKIKTISASPIKRSNRSRKRRSFVERTILKLARETERALFAEETARADGVLQRLDPRVKIIGFLALILAVTSSRNLTTIFVVFCLAIILAAGSRVSLRALATRAWIGTLVFTGGIALPVIFITPGDSVLLIPMLNWTITAQGLKSAAYLVFRVETTVTLSLLLVLTTLWAHVLKALRVLRVPAVLIVILGMTYRYLFVMLDTAQNMFEARQSRLVGALGAAQSRRVAAQSVGVLLTKSIGLNNEIFLAMQSRGFRGEIYTLDDFRMQPRDWLALAAFLAAAGAAFWLGRAEWLF